MRTLTVRFSEAELAAIDKGRGSQSRAAYVRSCVRRAKRSRKPPTRADALRILGEQAESGKVAAAIALEELTRQDEDLARLQGLTTDGDS